MSKYEAGTVSCYDTYTGKKHFEYATARCVHCCTPFKMRPGSGIRRGYCYNCGGLHCGKEACRTCNKGWEAMFEVLEGTRNPTAVSVAVPNLILPFFYKE